jgi:sugar lactone lactonase YvrE
MPSAAGVECVVKAEAIVGESPLWCPRDRVLYWVDITGQKIHRYHPGTGASDTFALPQPVTCVALRARGGLVITLRKNFAFFDPTTQRLEVLSDPEPGAPDNRFNDGKCDRQGRFWAGTMSSTHWDAPAGALYRLDADTRATLVQPGAVCANGIAWSPDDRTMYFVESFRYAIYAYDFDPAAGAVARRRVFASIDPRWGGFPDGLTVDADGCVWCVHNAVGRVVRYAPDGGVDRVIHVPVPRPCSCAFGGDRLDTLYVTTARETLHPDQLAQFPLSGSVFAIHPGVRGLAEPSFSG